MHVRKKARKTYERCGFGAFVENPESLSSSGFLGDGVGWGDDHHHLSSKEDTQFLVALQEPRVSSTTPMHVAQVPLSGTISSCTGSHGKNLCTLRMGAAAIALSALIPSATRRPNPNIMDTAILQATHKLFCTHVMSITLVSPVGAIGCHSFPLCQTKKNSLFLCNDNSFLSSLQTNSLFLCNNSRFLASSQTNSLFLCNNSRFLASSQTNSLFLCNNSRFLASSQTNSLFLCNNSFFAPQLLDDTRDLSLAQISTEAPKWVLQMRFKLQLLQLIIIILNCQKTLPKQSFWLESWNHREKKETTSCVGTYKSFVGLLGSQQL